MTQPHARVPLCGHFFCSSSWSPRGQQANQNVCHHFGPVEKMAAVSRNILRTIKQICTFPLIDTLLRINSNGNIFCVADPLCGEFTGPRWILRTKADIFNYVFANANFRIFIFLKFIILVGPIDSKSALVPANQVMVWRRNTSAEPVMIEVNEILGHCGEVGSLSWRILHTHMVMIHICSTAQSERFTAVG